MKVLITTVPFGDKNTLPLEMLSSAKVDYVINPLNKKLTENDLIGMVAEYDIIIAGTEPITKNVLEKASRLKMISRVGIGLDSVDLLAARDKGIKVSYTPDAPAPAVAELTLGLLISLQGQCMFQSKCNGRWHRYFGKRIADSTIGIIGIGRIGSRVINRMKAFELQDY